MRPSFFLIRTRLALGLGLILGFMVAMLLVSLFAMRRSHEQATQTLAVSAARSWQANVIRDAAYDLDNSVLTALLAKDNRIDAIEYDCRCGGRVQLYQATTRSAPRTEDCCAIVAPTGGCAGAGCEPESELGFEW
jgi:hypothetical protein